MEAIIRPTYEIDGEAFLIEHEHGLIWVSHPRWSLVGYGKTLFEAEKMMLDEAAEFATDLIQIPISDLSPSAIEFRNYLLEKVLPRKVA